MKRIKLVVDDSTDNALAWREAVAQGIETRQSQDGETRLGPKDESPTA